MGLTKSVLRTQLTDEHMQDVMLLASSKLTPELRNYQTKNINYHINIVLSIDVCCILCFRYELLKSGVHLFKIP